MGHIKLWDTILDCPKVHDLSDLAFRVWIKTLVTALRNGGRNGELPSMKVLAFRLRMKPAEIESALEELHQSGLIDPCPDNHIGGIPWKVHDWDEWQTPKDRTAAARQAKWRERQALRNAQRNGVGNASHNAQEGMKEEDIPPNPPDGGKPPKKRAPKFDPSTISLPDWMPVEEWNAWVGERMKSSKKPTENALLMAIKRLDRFRQEGDDIAGLLEAAAIGGWQGLPAPENRRGFRPNGHAAPAPPPRPRSEPKPITRAEYERRLVEMQEQ